MINSGPGVNILAHLGGLVVGLLIGYGIAITRKAKAKYQYKYSLNQILDNSNYLPP
jgi:membrane associated rhomboid family serine protease